MPGKVVIIQPHEPTLAVRLYLPLLQGMALTLKKFVANVLTPKTRPTIEYPEQRRDYSDRYRGRHILKTREDGSLKCVACYMCATACPADCIHIEAGEHPNLAYEKYPTVFEIDLLRCVMCGFCVDACPKDAIWMTKDYEMSYFSREDAVYGISKLTENPSDTAPNGPGYGYRPYYGASPAKNAGQFEPSGLSLLPMTLARNAAINRVPPPPPKPPAPHPAAGAAKPAA